MDPHLVAALDDGRIQILAALEHGPQAFGAAHALHRAVVAVLRIADDRQRPREPFGLLRTHAPEQGADLCVLQRRVDDVEQLVQRLRVLGIPVGRPIPVEDDAVWRG